MAHQLFTTPTINNPTDDHFNIHDLRGPSSNVPRYDRHSYPPLYRRQNKTTKRSGPRDSLWSRYKLGSPGSRRYQRILNEFLLWRMSRDMAQYEAEMSGTDTDNDSDFEIEDPEAHQPKYTPFSFLFLDMENMKKMEPFLDITIEEQEEFFRSLAKRKKHHHTHKHKHKHKQKHKQMSDSSEESEEIEVITPKESFQRINKRTRKLLQKHLNSKFLQEIDEQIYQLFKTCGVRQQESEHIRDSHSESTKPTNSFESDNLKTFTFQDSFHRCLVHGVSQYYCLKSYSVDSPQGRITIVERKTKYRLDPELTLLRYLQSHHHHHHEFRNVEN